MELNIQEELEQGDSMICDDCNKVMKHYQSTSFPIENGIYETKRYYRCLKCNTIKIITINPTKMTEIEVFKPRTDKQTTLFD